MVTGTIFLAINCVVAVRFVQDESDTELLALLYFAVFVDSLCNDYCTHRLSFTVVDGALAAAQGVLESQQLRASNELEQFVVARQARARGNSFGQMKASSFFGVEPPRECDRRVVGSAIAGSQGGREAP